MAKKVGRPKHSERDDASVKIDRALVSQGKILAASKGVTLAELLSELLREPMSRAWAGMVRGLDAKGGK